MRPLARIWKPFTLSVLFGLLLSVSLLGDASVAALARRGKMVVGGLKVFSISASTGNRVALTGRPGDRPRFSADRTKIALLRDEGLWVMRADGSNLRRIARGRIDYFDWAPDSRNLVFQRELDTTGHHMALFRVPISGSNPVRLTSGEYIEEEPRWSPDGEHIVFRRLHEVRVMNADGTDNRPVHERGNAIQVSPSFSPDGSTIAYSTVDFTVRPVVGTIERVNLDGTGHQVLARYTSPEDLPSLTSWSPDGTKIAFTRSGSKNTLHVMSPDGSNKKRLTPLRRIEDFDWSRDSTTLAYMWRRDGRGHVSVVAARSGNSRHLTSSENFGFGIDWN